MKLNLLASILWIILFFETILPQDVVVTLGGSTVNQAFSVKNSLGDTLLRVRGDGSVGIGTATPIGYFDIIGRENEVGNGKSINIISGSTIDPNGLSGDINIQTPGGELSGDINIQTGLTNEGSGKISIITGNSYFGQGGDISFTTGFGAHASGVAGKISLSCGYTENTNGSNIELKSGDGDVKGGDIILTGGEGVGYGGDIKLTPGSGLENAEGLVIVNGSGTYSGTWTQSSDVRFKKNIEPLNNSIYKIQQLDGVSYEFKKDEFQEKNFTEGKQIGLIAQDVEKVLPELVRTDNEGYKSIAYQNLVAVLVEAIKEQQISINELHAEIVKLKISSNCQRAEFSCQAISENIK